MTKEEYNEQLKIEINESQQSGMLTDNLHELFYKLITREIDKKQTRHPVFNLSIVRYSIEAHEQCCRAVSKFNLNKVGSDNPFAYFKTVILCSFAGTLVKQAKKFKTIDNDDTRPI